MKSVKIKIIILVMSCMMLTAVVIGGAGILNSEKAVNRDSTQIMNLLCTEKSQTINALLSRIEQSVKTLSAYTINHIDTASRFLSDSTYADRISDELAPIAINAAENTEGALTVYIRFNPELAGSKSGLFCSKEQSNAFTVLDPTDLLAYDRSDTSHVGWFYIPAENKKATWIPPYLNQNIGVEMISYVIPIYSGGSFIGVVGMDIDFEVLKQIVVQTTVYQTGYAFLTDDQSQIVYHKEIKMGAALVDYNGGEFSAMAQELFKESDGDSLFAYEYNRIHKKMAFKELDNGMRLVITAPSSEIDAEAHTLMVQIAVSAVLIVLISIILSIVETRRLVKPLFELNDAAQKIANGDLSVTITHHSKDEVGTLAESFRQTVNHLHTYIEYINELAYRDSLTGVKNKTAYLELVSKTDELIRLKRPEFAVVVFDINYLKAVNDTLGHDFGDMLIADACKIICKTFKRSPVYRIGGDEFVAILENSDFEQYQELLKAFEQCVAQYNEKPCNSFQISIARGIAVFNSETDLTYNDVFKRADSAMYRNKTEMKAKMEANPDNTSYSN